jgi:hypothetical protein
MPRFFTSALLSTTILPVDVKVTAKGLSGAGSLLGRTLLNDGARRC